MDENNNVLIYSSDNEKHAELNRFPNLNDFNDIVELFYADKHSTIEGAVAEAFTEQELVAPVFNNSLVNSGWWFGSDKWNQWYVHAVSEINPKNLREIEIENKVITTFKNKFDNVNWVFCDSHNNNYVRYSIGDDKFKKGKIYAGYNEYHMQPKTMTTVAENKYRSSERIIKAAKELVKFNALKSRAVQRLYANLFFPYKYIYDMDAIGVYRNNTFVFDYKHKYPSNASGVEEIGANSGISNLYDYLDSLGFKVVYLVWIKHDKNSNTPVSNYIDYGKHEWWACDAASFKNTNKRLSNKKGTGLSGDKPNSSKSLTENDFKKIYDADGLKEFLDFMIEN